MGTLFSTACLHCILTVFGYTFLMQGTAPLTSYPDQLQKLVHEQQKEIELLRAEIRLLSHHRFGSSSEKFSPDQMPLFLNPEADVKPAEEPRANITVISYVRKPRRRLGFDDDLPTDRVELDLPEDQKTCSCCAPSLKKIGEESSRQVEHVPATVRIKEYVRFKYACPHCEGEVKRAPAPSQYSLMETCRNYEINPLAYLTDILTRIAEEGPKVDYSAMMADVWKM